MQKIADFSKTKRALVLKGIFSETTYVCVLIPIEETINYIIERIYLHEKFTPVCSKLIFRRLLIKLTTECIFKPNSRFLKQVSDCSMGGQLSVTFSDIYMVKMENDVAILSKLIFIADL